MKPNLLTPLLLACLIAACNAPKQAGVVSKKATADPADLKGNWQLNYISGPRIAFEGLYPNKKPQISFDITASRTTGNTSCNNFSGPVSIEGSKISFNQPLTTTKMFCEGQGEPVFLESLRKITAWALTDTSTLTLIAGDIVLMRFIKVE